MRANAAWMPTSFGVSRKRVPAPPVERPVARPATMTPRRMATKRLGDIVAKDLRILLVAITPAPLSMFAGQHFATTRNPFWDLLYAAGLTASRLQPVEAPRLL